MKDTIRLTKRNKERLSFFHDDGNRAIEAVIDCLDSLQLKVDTYESMNRNPQNAPIDKSPGTFSSDCSTSVYGTSLTQNWIAKSQVASDGGLKMGDVSEKEFWKRMKTELDTTIQSYAGR